MTLYIRFYLDQMNEVNELMAVCEPYADLWKEGVLLLEAYLNELRQLFAIHLHGYCNFEYTNDYKRKEELSKRTTEYEKKVKQRVYGIKD